VAITGVANLAVKVRDIEDAVAFYRRAGAVVTDPEEWRGAQRADVQLSALQITLFTRAIYEDDAELPDEGWRPEVVSGPTFGTRRIAFVDAPGQMRLEFTE